MNLSEPQLFEGKTVKVLDSGIYRGDFLVENSSVSYTPIGKFLVGYGYTPKVSLLPAVLTAQLGDEAYGSWKRIRKATPYFLDTIGFSCSSDNSDQVFTSSDETLFSGFKDVDVFSGFSLSSTITFTQPLPYPSRIISLAIELDK